LTPIIKRSGNTEEFDRKKIEDSLRNAGADLFTAKQIRDKIQEGEWMTTSDIREALGLELKEISCELSERYSQVRRFTARNSSKISKGIARLSRDSIDALEVRPGDTLEIKYRDRWQKMRVELDDSPSSHGEIILNSDDMVAIGVVDGNRVKARKYS
jgi:hypothetical protein